MPNFVTKINIALFLAAIGATLAAASPAATPRFEIIEDPTLALCPIPADRNETPATTSVDPDFFAQHPLRGCLHTETDNRYTPYPFQAFGGHISILVGTVDLDGARAITQGSGYSPLKVKGENRAYVSFMVNHIPSSTVGAYNEFFTVYAVTKDDDSTATKEFANVNAISPIAALFANGVVSYFNAAFLDDQDAIDYGRDTMGFDKKLAKVSVQESGVNNEMFAYDENHLRVLHAMVSENPADMQDAVVNGLIPSLVANGITPPPAPTGQPAIQPMAAVSRLPGGPTVVTTFYNRQASLFRKLDANDTVTLGDAPVAQKLKNMHFRATAISWSNGGVGAIESPLWFPVTQ